STGLLAGGIFATARTPQKTTGKLLLFLSTDCPVAMRYAPRVAELHKQFGESVSFKAYFPNDLETRQGIEHYLKERELDIPFEMDLGAVLAKKEGITHVPTVVIYDARGRKVYQGAIDDNKDPGLVKHRFAAAVLHDLHSGKAVKFSKSETFGCVLMPSAEPPKETKVNYAEHIAPILNRACLECHRPGEVAPFSLVSYEQARKWAPMIAIATESRRMPPWKAVHGFGEFLDENRLTETEIETLKRWEKAGMPKGDVKKIPAAPKFHEGWALGKPDLVLQPEKVFKLEADGSDVYRNFVFQNTSEQTRYVTAMDVKPGNTKVVHHVIAFVDTSGRADALEARQADGQAGYTTFGGPGFLPDTSLGGWAPGLRPRFTPEGTAFELKPGAKIVMQVHYHKSGKAEEDQTRMGIYLAKQPPKQVMQLAWIANPLFRIPPGAKDHKIQMTYTVGSDRTFYSFLPHMHLLGKSMKATAELPDGTVKPIIFVDDWDFNWQMNYALKEPLRLPKGSKIRVEGVYDNSAENPRNPNNPPKPITWGEETTDEMFLLVGAFTIDGRMLDKK
ncbi:MAG TPA: hypothetical protein VEX38_01805, partial [Fimbriimonadaceae bacterium]|nr:hypothetical protein [Fimbriimonadaceae bacterium]